MGLAKGMDPLGALSDDSDEEEEEEQARGEGAEGDADADPAPPAKKPAIDYATLQSAGYRSGPSILHVPAPKAGEGNWTWGGGARVNEAEESADERIRTRDAANQGAQEMAARALMERDRALALKDQQRADNEAARKAELARVKGAKKGLKDLDKKAAARGGGQEGDKKHESWNAKEKRKREQGKASNGVNYVEEEKRMLREFGSYSGFD